VETLAVPIGIIMYISRIHICQYIDYIEFNIYDDDLDGICRILIDMPLYLSKSIELRITASVSKHKGMSACVTYKILICRHIYQNR
jgi:hypothetical protein